MDASIRDYVTAYPRSGPAPTLRQLGGHLGGIRHYEGAEAINTRHYGSVTDSLRVFIDDPLVAAAGRGVSLLELRLQSPRSGRRDGHRLRLRTSRPPGRCSSRWP